MAGQFTEIRRNQAEIPEGINRAAVGYPGRWAGAGFVPGRCTQEPFKYLVVCSHKRRHAAWAKGCRADVFPPEISALARTEAPARGLLGRGRLKATS